LYDDSGQVKTTYSSFLTQIHNRGEGITPPPRLDASIPASIDILYEKDDCVLVLDDLCPLESKNAMAKQEETLIQVTRIVGDGTSPARKRGNKTPSKPPPKRGVLFTAEYPIGVGSTAARLLSIQLKQSIDDRRFKKCIDKPLAISTFHHFFITWMVENFENIMDLLKKWWDEYTQMNLGVHKRLRETHFYLNTTNKIFLLYCLEKGFTTEESAKREQVNFQNHLNDLVMLQEKRVQQGKFEESKSVDYLKLIQSMVKQGNFYLAKNSKKYDSDYHDGLIHNDLLCLRSDVLLNEIRKVIPTTTLSEIKNALNAKNALKLDGEGKNYKIGNNRFYGIYVNKLK